MFIEHMFIDVTWRCLCNSKHLMYDNVIFILNEIPIIVGVKNKSIREYFCNTK